MIKILGNLVGEIQVWETEFEREEGLPDTHETRTVKNSEDIAELMEMVDNLAEENEAVELDLYYPDGKWIRTLYHNSVDGVEYMCGEEELSAEQIAERINNILSHN